jgi:hypothetical protein
VRLEKTSDLLRREVYFRDIKLGVPVDALFDAPLARLLGVDVRCGDGGHRFLPFGACDVADDRIRVDSALVLTDGGFYRQRGRALSELRGAVIRERGEERGRLEDVLVEPDGSVAAFEADGARVPAGPTISVGGEPLRAAV